MTPTSTVPETARAPASRVHPRLHRPRLGIVVLVSLLCAGSACAPPRTQEQQVRDALVAIDAAASRKDAQILRDAISESYRDAKSRTKEDLSAFITYFFFKRKDVYTLSFVYDVDLPTPDRAEATVYAALAATPLESREDVARFDADLWRFDVTLAREDDDWKVAAADWSPVDPRDAADLFF